MSTINNQNPNANRSHGLDWLFKKSVTPESPDEKVYKPYYGDVTELNTCRLIMDSVGRDALRRIAEDAIDLLETSVAIYEANGDYAWGVFSSGWCQLMDTASRKRCNTDDNRTALDCGRWHCHDNCWNDSAKKALETGRSTDIQCVGGINLYGEPIYAGKTLVGVINIGYGAPPKDPDRLQKLADLYETDVQALKEQADAYELRPQYFEELSKKRLRNIATIIGGIVEKALLQKSLAENEKKLDTILNRSPFPIAVVDETDENIAYWSQSAIDTFGHNPKSVSEWYALAYPDPDYREKAIQRWKPLLKQAAESDNAVNTGEYQIVCKDGTVKTCEIYAQFIPGNLIVTLNDITERGQAETTLKTNEAKFRSYVDNAPDGIFIVNEKGEYIDVNPAACEMTGYSEKELLSLSIPDLLQTDDREDGMSGFRELSQKGSMRREVGYVTKAGKKRFWHVAAVKLSDTRFLGFAKDITARKHTEAALQESETRLRDAQRIANIGNWSLDLQTGRVEMSDEMLNLIGLKDMDEARDVANHEKCYTPESWQRFNRAVETAINTGSSYEIELEFADRNAPYLYAVARGEAICDEKKKVTGLHGTLQDITERTQAANEIRLREMHLSSLLENPAGYIIYRTRLNRKTGQIEVVQVSPSFSDVLGITEADKDDFQQWFTHVHPEDLPVLLKASNDGMKPPFTLTAEVRYNHPVEGLKWFDLRAKGIPYADDPDIIEYANGLILDITERKKAEQALQENENKLKNIIENSTNMFYSHSTDNVITYVSPQVRGILGYEPEEVMRKWTELITDNPINVHALKLTEEAIATGKRQPVYQMEMVRKDGRYITVEVREAPVIENGNVVSLVGSLTDITQRKKLEQEKERFEEQIQQSQKIEAVGILAGGIAHDFNNMLGVITGNTTYALSYVDENDKLYEVLSDIQESSKQAQSLTHQLLTFAKGGEPVKKVLNINTLLKNSALFSSRGSAAECRFALAGEVWMSEVDEGQFNQVIGNLMINANQAMPNGGTITITTENTEIKAPSLLPLPDGNYVKLTIADQGIGISPEHLPNIFDPYFTTKQKGSGLGLATTYSIVKKHGGHITVSSELGKGTAFTIYFPACAKGSGTTEKKQNAGHTGQGTILVMDDQEQLLTMAGRMLKRMGYNTVCATDGTRAIKLYREALESGNAFDLVILDLTVPGGMGGAETMAELLKIDPDVKAVVSSGYSTDPIMAHYEEYGFYGVIPKPYSLDNLSEMLNQVSNR